MQKREEENRKYDKSGYSEDFTENFSQQDQLRAQQMRLVLKDEIISSIFSKNQELIVVAINFIISGLQNRNIQYKQELQLSCCVFSIVSLVLKSQSMRLQLISMQLMQTFCQIKDLKQYIINDANIQEYFKQVVGKLVDLISEKDYSIKSEAVQTLYSMGKSAVILNQEIVIAIAEGEYVSKQKLNEIDNIEARINLLTEFVQFKEIENQEIYLKPVVEFAAVNYIRQSIDLKRASQQLLVEIFILIGQINLKPHLSCLENRHIQKLQNEIREQTGQKVNLQSSFVSLSSSFDPPQNYNEGSLKGNNQMQPETNNKTSNMRDRTEQAQQIDRQPRINEKCQFCEIQDIAFNRSTIQDVHLWKQCPMLTVCKYCGQVVEVIQIISHYLEECASRKDLITCELCDVPVKIEQYSIHKKKECRPQNQFDMSDRCPLCYQEIFPSGHSGWKSHFVEIGCMKNRRNKRNQDPQNNKKENKPVVVEKEQQIDLNTCQFCGKFSEQYADQVYLDLHYYQECQMLMKCQLCQQIEEIGNYTSHCLNECSQKLQFLECTTCKEAIHNREYKFHISSRQCKQKQPTYKANRCPLCHYDINPGLAGWKEHLLEEGCSFNQRNK